MDNKNLRLVFAFVGLIVLTIGEVVYLTNEILGLLVVAVWMLVSGLGLAFAYARPGGTKAVRIAAWITGVAAVAAAAAPGYQAYRLANDQPFLMALMVGFVAFGVSLAVASVALRRARLLPLWVAVLTPLSFVAWLIMSTAFPSWGGIAGAVVYAALVGFELFALRDVAAKPIDARKAAVA